MYEYPEKIERQTTIICGNRDRKEEEENYLYYSYLLFSQCPFPVLDYY
jgi:hypothetical protein